MNQMHIAKISSELSLKPNHVAATAELLDGGATVPFIFRYRKEATGSLDEVAITAIRDRLNQLKELDDRREAIIKSLEERELLTEELKEQIMQELAKPGRDPRRQFEVFSFADGVEKIEDVEVGMRLPGIVTNVAAFGAFVDIGVHQDGLVHISQLADRYVKDPHDVVKVHQKVMVTVLDVDIPRKRISLSMKK